MPTVPDPPAATAPPHPPTLRRRTADSSQPSSTAGAPPAAASVSHASQIQQNAQQTQHQQQQPSLRSRAMAGAMGLGLVTAAVGGTYLLSENEAVFPFAVAACVATFSSVLLRFALVGVSADGAQRARHRHFRAHRHFTGERAAYVRTSQRLAMMDRDFTAADYEMLLDLDNNSQRLRRFLEGASDETVARLPTYTFKGKTLDSEAGVTRSEDGERDMSEAAAGRTGSTADVGRDAGDLGDPSELTGATAKKCTICLEDFEDGMKIRILPCFHRFMATCIDPWLVQQARCPVCKCSIQEVMNSLPPGCK